MIDIKLWLFIVLFMNTHTLQQCRAYTLLIFNIQIRFSPTKRVCFNVPSPKSTTKVQILIVNSKLETISKRVLLSLLVQARGVSRGRKWEGVATTCSAREWVEKGERSPWRMAPSNLTFPQYHNLFGNISFSHLTSKVRNYLVVLNFKHGITFKLKLHC